MITDPARRSSRHAYSQPRPNKIRSSPRVLNSYAADTVGTDPDDLSFIRSYRAIRRQVPNQAGLSP